MINNVQCGDGNGCHPIINEYDGVSMSYKEALIICASLSNCAALEISPSSRMNKNEENEKGTVWLAHTCSPTCGWSGGSIAIKQGMYISDNDSY